MRESNLYKVDWWMRRPSKGYTRNRGDVGLFGGYCNQIHVHPAIVSCMLEHLLFQSTKNMPSSPLWGEICLWGWIADNQKNFLNVKVNIIWCLWTETGGSSIYFIFFLGVGVIRQFVFTFYISIDTAIILFKPYMQKLGGLIWYKINWFATA